MKTESETIDPEKLYYPTEIAGVIGLSKNEIAFLKRKGCPFYGKKTTVRWVRDFIAKEAGASQSSPELPEHPASSAVYKPDERSGKSGSPTASLQTR